MDEAIIIIRLFQSKDAMECQRIVHRATMSTTLPSFRAAITREIYLQLVVVISAFMFVFTGMSPMYCCLSFPLSALIIYIVIYSAHYVKSAAMSPDMGDITEYYMSSRRTAFLVAEAFLPPGSDETKCIRILDESSALSYFSSETSRWLIGTLAIAESNSDPMTAWIRRMAVEPQWKRRGIASALLDHALIFCHNAGYSNVELVTTECHEEARKLYTNKGFQLKQLYHKQIVPNLVQILMYQYATSV